MSTHSPKKNESPIQTSDAKRTCRSSILPPGRNGRYDIQTLLNIGRQLEPRKPLAIRTGFRDVQGSGRGTHLGSRVLREKSMNHQRNSSTLSGGTDDGRENLNHPRRQPVNAPQGTLAQSHAGFARFLKEHSSPKHHRVTAGGRIVPMSFHAPAPEFKLFINGVAGSCLEDHELPPMNEPLQHISKPEAHHKNAIVRQQRSPFAPKSKAIPIKAPPPNFEKTYSLAHPKNSPVTDGQTTATTHSVTSISKSTKQNFRVPSASNVNNSQKPGTTPFSTISKRPTNLMPDGDNERFELYASNSQAQPSLDLGNRLLTENMQQNFQVPQVPQTNNMVGIYQMGSSVPIAQPSQFPPMGNGLAGNPYLGYPPIPTTVSTGQDSGARLLLESAVQDYDSVSNQLSNLDRYMALHTWDIDPTTKKLLVEQRVELVRKLDSARVYKEHLESTFQHSRLEGMTANLLSDFSFTTNSSQTGQIPLTNAFTNLQLATNNPGIYQAGGYFQPGLNATPNVSPVTNGNIFSMDLLHPTHAARKVPAAQYIQPDAFNNNCESARIPADLNLAMTAASNWNMATDVARGNYLHSPYDPLNTVGGGMLPFERKHSYEKSSTPLVDLDAIYYRIEEAIKRKEPLEPYFKELGKLTGLTHGPRHPSRSHNLSQDFNNSWGSTGMVKDGPGLKSGQASQLQMVEEPQMKSPHSQGKASSTRQARQHVSGPQAKGCTCAKARERFSKDSNNMDSTHQTDSQHKTGAILSSFVQDGTIAQCKKKCEETVGKKGNALKSFPTFDGSGEVDTHSQQATSTSLTGNNSNGKGKPALQELDRTSPNPMDVRAFFQLLREEDQKEIRKHETQAPPF
ncbi:hypothetical protein LOZ61_000904 [Ophidiomyces ophidiicola]|nr:hypothetical protein LOZ61_000904 [Ophidiomyces ophidiicola]KAI1925833.1 hypothetical protein LOZ60_003889 [Ophidiomyces ophidiicola]KAI1964251.1 hypothetical protein LOZ59_001552 [Ophidiomyces ophidiicola]KAI2031841.1 hypothetical protein LOZ45_001291 [Ophidiomyces ophidiicola]KAI2037399.1 hypothetical protein LOZ48_000479 [Ophidiomyces ophidiicola]